LPVRRRQDFWGKFHEGPQGAGGYGMQPFIGSRIKLYRSMAGKTQEQLSVELDITKQHLGLIERGEANPSLDLLKRACRAFAISPASFFLGCSCDAGECGDSAEVQGDIPIDPVSSCGTWVVNLDDGRITWSDSLHRLMGESPRLKPSLKRFGKHVDPLYREDFLKYYDEVVSTRTPRPFRCTLVRRDGEQRAVQIQADIVAGGLQGGDMAVFSVMDITELEISQRLLVHNQRDLEDIVQEKTRSLRQAADGLQGELERRSEAEQQLRDKSRALQESETNFRSFFETVGDMIVVADENGAILHANQAALAKTGYGLEELRRMRVRDLYEKSRHGELRGIYEALVRGERNTCDLPIVCSRGRLIPVETHIWRGKWNGMPCLFGISKELLRVSSTLLRLICDNVPDLIWAKDLNKRYIFANTAICHHLLSAESTEEPLGKTDLFFAERERNRYADNPEWHTFGEICRDTDQITMDAGRPQQFDEYGNVKGRFMFLDVHKAPLYDDQGIMIGTVGSAREVTEQRRMAQALETSNTALITILDSLPADVYVSDLETRRVLFMNRRMKKSFGRDCTGEICHEAFRDSIARCGFCTSPDLTDWEGKPVGTVSWERFNPVSGRWYINYDQAIDWIDGSKARIQIAMDITDRKQAEDSLRSERDLFSAGPVVTFVWEPEPGWPVRYVSANCEAVLGYTPGEMTSDDFTYDSLIHPDDLDRVREEVAGHLRDGVDRFEQSYRLMTREGRYIWVFDFTKFDRDENGKVVSICGYMFDQSRMKEMERVLQEERERLTGIIEGTNAGTWEWNVLTGETIFDDRWAEIIGYSPEELAPVSIRTWMRLTHPDDLRRCMRLLERHFDYEKSHFEAEMRMRHKDGRWVWVLGRGKVSAWTPDGRPVIMRGTNQDITGRKTAEEALRRTNSHLQAIIDALPGTLNVVDTEYNILRSNMFKSETIFGSVADCVHTAGRKCFDIFQQRDTPCPWCKIGQVLATGEPVVEMTEPGDPREQATGRAFQVFLNPVKDENGAMLGAVEYGVDITELRQAREHALAASQAKTNFLASMSHDIRTPLNGIMGMLELMRQEGLDGEQDECAATALEACRTLELLLSDILDLSRVEAGMLSVRRTPMDLRGVLSQVRDLFAPLAAKQGIELRLEADPQLPERVLGDPGRLYQVLTNFVGNAVKFTAAGGVLMEAWVLPRLKENQVTVLFTITDTGVGIDDDKLGLLFRPFAQIGDAQGLENRGFGLGLSICRHLVELMGGNLAVLSQPGEGTSVACGLSFDLEAADQATAAEEADVIPETALEGRRILLVEDDRVSALVGRKLLERRGALVRHVDDGHKALETLRDERFDLVLMDIGLPTMDGIEATRAIRRGDAGEAAVSLPIIALTAHAMNGDRERFKAEGVDDYVSKPVDVTRLLQVIIRLRPA
jgi:PAS domain S-box-containing protein